MGNFELLIKSVPHESWHVGAEACGLCFEHWSEQTCLHVCRVSSVWV